MVKRVPNIEIHAEALRLIEKAPRECPKYWENELIQDLFKRGAMEIAYEMAHIVAPEEDEQKRVGGKEAISFTKPSKLS